MLKLESSPYQSRELVPIQRGTVAGSSSGSTITYFIRQARNEVPHNEVVDQVKILENCSRKFFWPIVPWSKQKSRVRFLVMLLCLANVWNCMVRWIELCRSAHSLSPLPPPFLPTCFSTLSPVECWRENPIKKKQVIRPWYEICKIRKCQCRVVGVGFGSRKSQKKAKYLLSNVKNPGALLYFPGFLEQSWMAAFNCRKFWRNAYRCVAFRICRSKSFLEVSVGKGDIGDEDLWFVFL